MIKNTADHSYSRCYLNITEYSLKIKGCETSRNIAVYKSDQVVKYHNVLFDKTVD